MHEDSYCRLRNRLDEWRDFKSLQIDSDQLPFVRLEKIHVPDEESLEGRK